MEALESLCSRARGEGAEYEPEEGWATRKLRTAETT